MKKQNQNEYEGTFIYAGDVRQEQFDIQSAIDEKIQDINEYYNWDKFSRGCVSVYESTDLLDPDRAIAIRLGWSSIGEVSIEEAEAFVRVLEAAISQAKLAQCPGFRVTYDKDEANYSPYGNTDDDTDTNTEDDTDTNTNDDTNDNTEGEFIINTEIETEIPASWWWLDSVLFADERNIKDGVYEVEGKTAELAAFEAISIVEDIKDDTIKRTAETEAVEAYEAQLDAVARIMAYNEICQKWRIDDLMPRLSIKVTMHMIPNDGEIYEDEETIMAVCDDVAGAVVYDDEHPSKGISMTCREWKLVEESSNGYRIVADENIIRNSIEG